MELSIRFYLLKIIIKVQEDNTEGKVFAFHITDLSLISFLKFFI